jgi:hypothetical protein
MSYVRYTRRVTWRARTAGTDGDEPGRGIVVCWIRRGQTLTKLFYIIIVLHFLLIILFKVLFIQFGKKEKH